MNTQLITEITTYVKDLKSNYELRLAQEWQKGYGIGYKQGVESDE
jgi:hypothetical protein